ncbi:MAG: FtsL-like putative cell division protein [Saprospiraceae bacterium]
MAKKKKTLTDYLSIGQMSSEWILKNVPFVFFLVFLLIAYIANAHYSEKKIRAIQGLQKEVKELRWEYNSLKSGLMYSTKQSEVVKAVAPMGLKPMKGKPKKIVINKRERK